MEGFPDSFAGVEADVYIADYADCVNAAGGFAVHLPQATLDHHGIDAVLGRLDGLVLSGGADLQPSLYGATAETDEYPPEPRRDEFEAAVTRRALDTAVPVLGICRGLQLLNVLEGGTLHQDVPAHARYDVAPDAATNEVAIDPGSILFDCFGSTASVNSLHHQTVDQVAPGWRVTATAADGVVEGMELPGRPVVAVQWHPELMGEQSRRLFEWLIDRAREHASTRDERRTRVMADG